MERAQKTAAVAELQSELTKSKNAILFGFAGLKVPEVTELRRQVRGTRSRYVVVKNTLALRAARGTAMEGIARHFAGPTAVAFNQNDPVGLAKVLTAFAKTNPNLVFKGALIEGRPVDASEIKTIAVVREVTSLGLKEAKDVVDGAPGLLKEGVSKDEAANIKKKFEEVGAKVEIK